MSPTSEQYDSLLRQMWERMDEGCGETIYVIGQGSGEHSFPFLYFKQLFIRARFPAASFLTSVSPVQPLCNTYTTVWRGDKQLNGQDKFGVKVPCSGGPRDASSPPQDSLCTGNWNFRQGNLVQGKPVSPS